MGEKQGENIGWEEEIWGGRRNMDFCGGAGEVIAGGTLGGKSAHGGETVGSGPGCGHGVTLEVVLEEASVMAVVWLQRWPWCGHDMALECGPGVTLEVATRGMHASLRSPPLGMRRDLGQFPLSRRRAAPEISRKQTPNPPLFRTSLCCYAIRWVLIAAMHKEKAHQEALSCSTWIPGPAHVC